MKPITFPLAQNPAMAALKSTLRQVSEDGKFEQWGREAHDLKSAAWQVFERARNGDEMEEVNKGIGSVTSNLTSEGRNGHHDLMQRLDELKNKQLAKRDAFEIVERGLSSASHGEAIRELETVVGNYLNVDPTSDRPGAEGLAAAMMKAFRSLDTKEQMDEVIDRVIKTFQAFGQNPESLRQTAGWDRDSVLRSKQANAAIDQSFPY
jgi:hypothetical protein